MYIELTRSQIGLLNLCKLTPGPSLEEMFKYGESHGVSLNSIHEDFICLLSNKLVCPLGFIDREIFLPTLCLMTDKGENLLTQLLRENSEKVPQRQIRLLWNSDKINVKSSIDSIKKYNDLNESTIQELSDTYLYWAEIGNTGQVRISDTELAFVAAIGYYKINELIRFSKAISIWYKSYEKKGDFLDLAVLTNDAIKKFPLKEDFIVKVASEILSKAYWDLTGKTIKTIKSKEEFNKFLKSFFSIALKTGNNYQFQLPHKNSLVGISNRIEDILGESFRTSNQSLYFQTIDLFGIYIELLGGIVKINNASSHFEQISGFDSRLALANRICLILESKYTLIFLQDTDRKIAYDLILKIIRIIIGSIGVPIWDLCDINIPNDDKNKYGHWIFNLLRNPEIKIRYELIELFKQLDIYIENATVQKESKEKILSFESDLKYIKYQVAKLDSIDNSIEIIENVRLPEIENLLAIILNISSDSNEQTRQICDLIIKSDLLVENIDKKLNIHLNEFKNDINNWIQIINGSEKMEKKEKETFLKDLGDILNFSSSSKIFATIPLIPGFLKYQFELNLKTDWNKWLQKLKEKIIK
jgi:hypothetical protein